MSLIHSLVILKKGGIPIYQRNFTDKLNAIDFNLLSSFLTGLLQFSSAVMKKDLNILEFGDLRFFIRGKSTEDIKLVLITDTTVCALLIKDRIKRMDETFFSIYDPITCNNIDSCIEDEKVNEKIDLIANMKYDDITGDAKDIIFPLQDLFENEINKGEINSGALMSTNGNIYYSSLQPEYLNEALKELELRIQSNLSDLKSMPKTIYQTENRLVFSQIIESTRLQMPIIVILQFNQGHSLGMGDYQMEDMIKKLQELL